MENVFFCQCECYKANIALLTFISRMFVISEHSFKLIFALIHNSSHFYTVSVS